MTISTQNRTAGPFAGNGVTAAFPFTFKVFQASDLKVVRRVDATEVETVLIPNTNYTVTLNPNQNANPGGTVTLSGPLALGQTLTVTTELAYLQQTELTNQGGFYPQVITNALDRLTIFTQQLFAGLNRSLKYPLSDTGIDPTLPGKNSLRGRVLAFHETTGRPIAGPSTTSVGTVSGAIGAVQTVADNIVDVNTVAGNIADVNAVGQNIGDVNDVAGNLAAVGVVANNIAEVNLVAANIGDVTNFADVYLGPRAADPSTRSDGSALAQGDLYFNTETDRLRVYTGTRWSEANTGTVSVQQFTGDGVTVDFPLNGAPDNENVVQVFVGGVYQSKTVYDITGPNADVLTFTSAPPNDADIEVVTFSVLPLGVVDASQVQMPGGGSLDQLGAANSTVTIAGQQAEKYFATFDTVAEMQAAVTAAYVGRRVQWLGYHALSDGGSGWGVVKSGSYTADGGSIIAVGPSLYIEQALKGKALNVRKFGAKFNGVDDDTNAINAATKWKSLNGGGKVRLPSGTALIGTLTATIYSTEAGVLAGYNSWALLFARDNVIVEGEGDATILKAANGLVATNANLAGTKGYQVFVHEDYLTPVNNFTIRNFTVDFNGYNNLMQPLNGFGNQSLVHGIYIETGDNIKVEQIKWKDHSGHQIVLLQYGTTRCKVIRNEFYNCGWLGGANPLLTDHSSIYCAGQGWEVSNNKLIQPDYVPVGAGLELHGSGVARFNRVEKYAAIGNLAALVTDNNDIELYGNVSLETGGGWGIYCTGGRKLKIRLTGANDFQLNGKVATPFPLVGEFKQMFYCGENSVFADGSEVTIESKGNKYSVNPNIEWTGDAADLLSAFLVAQSCKVSFADTIQGFRGPIAEIQRSLVDGTIDFTGSTFIGCGRKDDFVTQNSMFNYTNGGDVSYGNRLFALTLNNNKFVGMSYASYLSVEIEAIGIALCPLKFIVDGDYHDKWIPPLITTTANAPSILWKFRYTCEGVPNAAKPLYQSNPWVTQTMGVINSEYPLGWSCTFETRKDINQWNFSGTKFDTASPTEARPFGDLVGDKYEVLIPGGGSPCQYRCTVAGVGGAVGTWAGLTLN